MEDGRIEWKFPRFEGRCHAGKMLESMAHRRHFDEPRRTGAVGIDQGGDALVVVAAHDPIELPVQDQGWDRHVRPGLFEIQALELMIERRRPSILMSSVARPYIVHVP